MHVQICSINNERSLRYLSSCSTNNDKIRSYLSSSSRNSLSHWYLRFVGSPEKARELAMLVTKYIKRGKGWSHRDVLHLAHLKPNPGTNDNGVAAIMKYVVKGFRVAEADLRNYSGLLEYFQAVESVKTEMNPAAVTDLIRRHKLVREHVNTQLLKTVAIWEALLENMPMTAMIRNLGKMISLGMLDPQSVHEKTIRSRLDNLEKLRKARIHPFCLLIALLSYKTGKSRHGTKWTPNDTILKALDSAFYLTFKLVEPTNKSYLVAVNVSESMYNDQVNGCSHISPAAAAAALSLVTARTERQCEVIAFSDRFVEVKIGAHMNLSNVEKAIQSVRPGTGGIDCSLPMQYALKYKKKFDVIIVYTNHQNNAGYIHAVDQLNVYRRVFGINVKLIMCAMSITSFSIADPDDTDVMHVPGFDTDAPEVMKDFIMHGLQPRPGN